MLPQHDSPLGSIATEIIQNVASHLPVASLGALRLSCRLVNHRIFEGFDARFPTRKQFIISESGLQTLSDISQHPRLACRLSHIIIGIDARIPGHTSACTEWHSDRAALSDSASGDWESEDETMSMTIKAQCEEQEEMLAGDAARILVRVLNNFPRLDTVTVQDYPYRYNLERTHQPPVISNFHVSCFSFQIFSAVVLAASKAGRHLKRLHLLICMNQEDDFDDTPQRLSIPVTFTNKGEVSGVLSKTMLTSTLQNLTFLRLSTTMPRANDFLRTLIFHGCELETLWLNFEEQNEGFPFLIGVLSVEPFLQKSHEKILPRLRRLALTSLTVKPEALASLFVLNSCVSSLEVLVVRSCTLVSDFQVINQEGPSNIWALTLDMLAEITLHRGSRLSRVILEDIDQETPTSGKRHYPGTSPRGLDVLNRFEVRRGDIDTPQCLLEVSKILASTEMYPGKRPDSWRCVDQDEDDRRVEELLEPL